MKRINLLSSPRNVSTALMYSFAQRKDTVVVDEPLYAYYLAHTGIVHPGQDEILASQSQDAQEVIKTMISGKWPKTILFLKNMAHHIIGIDEQFLENLINIIFIRQPKQIIASYAKVREKPTIEDIGTLNQYRLYQKLKKVGNNPIVLDSAELLKAPKVVLKQLCEQIGIPFMDTMLQWEAGVREEDGVWAKYWYTNVHKTTGFQIQKTSSRNLPEDLEPLYEKLRPYYEEMAKYSIKAK
ncbi:MAG: sulfotransferase family protein [Aureispira sp.]|nr:sulfotransferase family protein [Aureispira sp.]